VSVTSNIANQRRQAKPLTSPLTDAEVGIGFFVGSLSTLRPLFSQLLRLGGSTRRGRRDPSHEMGTVKPPSNAAAMAQSRASCSESQEDLVTEGIFVSKSIQQSSQRHLAV